MKEYIVQAIAQETIDSFDAHNAPELVRCKDCKHYLHLRTNPGYCTRDGSRWIFRDLDWFCAGGERKIGERGNDGQTTGNNMA